MTLPERWNEFKVFLTEVKKEAGKVSWPGRDEVWGTTVVVLVSTVIFGVFLFAVDALMTPAMNALFHAFGS